MLQHTYLNYSSIKLKKEYTNNVTTLLKYKASIELVCVNSYKKYYYSVLAGFIINYKNQVFITGIKINMQYPICYVYQKKKN